MGNATSLFNFMRNVGGSVGIATATTLISRYTQKNIGILNAHVNATSPQAQQMLEMFRSLFLSRGADAVTATKQAYASIAGVVARQATMLSFVGVFRLLAGIFLLMIPLLLLLKRPKHSTGPVAAH
jgi:DHA2 family multidrug resistance protein